MWTLMMHSMSTVVQKKAWISVGLKLFGVLHRWIDYWTRLPAIVLTPCALETRRAIVPRSQQPTRCYYPSFESTRHQKDSWESCPMIDPSVEPSKKLKTNAYSGFFLELAHVDTMDIERVISVCTCSKPPRLSPPPMFACTSTRDKKISFVCRLSFICTKNHQILRSQHLSDF